MFIKHVVYHHAESGWDVAHFRGVTRSQIPCGIAAGVRGVGIVRRAFARIMDVSAVNPFRYGRQTVFRQQIGLHFRHADNLFIAGWGIRRIFQFRVEEGHAAVNIQPCHTFPAAVNSRPLLTPVTLLFIHVIRIKIGKRTFQSEQRGA